MENLPNKFMEKNISVEKFASDTVEQFQKIFSDYTLTFDEIIKEEQGPTNCVYSFTVASNQFPQAQISFFVKQLDIQSVQEAFTSSKKDMPTLQDEIDMMETALQVIEYFPENLLEYRGIQSGWGPTHDTYLFNITNKQSAAYDATFGVEELNVRSVGEALIKTMEKFGEDVEKIKENFIKTMKELDEDVEKIEEIA